MKSYKQFREEESVLDKKRQEMMKSRDNANRDFEKSQRQDEIKRTIRNNKIETDIRLDDMENTRKREMQKLRKDLGI